MGWDIPQLILLDFQSKHSQANFTPLLSLDVSAPKDSFDCRGFVVVHFQWAQQLYIAFKSFFWHSTDTLVCKLCSRVDQVEGYIAMQVNVQCICCICTYIIGRYIHFTIYPTSNEFMVRDMSLLQRSFLAFFFEKHSDAQSGMIRSPLASRQDASNEFQPVPVCSSNGALFSEGFGGLRCWTIPEKAQLVRQSTALQLVGLPWAYPCEPLAGFGFRKSNTQLTNIWWFYR